MGNDLYSADYLKQTFDFLRQIKEQTYAPFLTQKGGIIADIGCGTGLDAVNLATLVDDSTKVIGLDHDEQLMAAAKEQNQSKANLSFVRSDAGSLPFQDGELSGLRNERLIQHLANPEAVYQEFFRVLKPGAPAVFVETDWNSLAIYNGGEAVKAKLLHFLTFRRVPNGNAASKAAQQLSNIGFTNISVKIFPLVSYDLLAASSMIQLEWALQQMENEQIIREDERLQFWNELTEANVLHAFAASINFVMVSACK